MHYFSNLFLEWNSTCFGQFLCPSSWVFHCTHSNGTGWHKKMGTFEKPNKNWRNPRKKNLL